MKNVLDVAKLLNSCGFVSCLILLQKLLSLFATWLEPISKYRNASCNNLNELTINFFYRFRIIFWIMFFFWNPVLFGFLLAFAFTKYNNFADYLVSEIWQFGRLNKLLVAFLFFHLNRIFALKSVPFVFGFQNFSRYVCIFFEYK